MGLAQAGVRAASQADEIEEDHLVHLARGTVDAVDQLDLSIIEGSYNQEGDGPSAIERFLHAK